jgi:hypothetical protein
MPLCANAVDSILAYLNAGNSLIELNLAGEQRIEKLKDKSILKPSFYLRLVLLTITF